MITLNSQSSTGAGTVLSASPFLHNHTIAAVSNTVMIFFMSVSNGGGSHVNHSAFWNGQAMTKLSGIDLATGQSTSIWYLVNPQVGAFQVVASWTGGNAYFSGGVLAYDGVDQATPIDVDAGIQAINTGVNFSQNITPSVANTVSVGLVGSQFAPINQAPETSRWQDVGSVIPDSKTAGSDLSTPIAGNLYTFNWGTGLNDFLAYDVFSLKPVAQPAESPFLMNFLKLNNN